MARLGTAAPRRHLPAAPGGFLGAACFWFCFFFMGRCLFLFFWPREPRQYLCCALEARGRPRPAEERPSRAERPGTDLPGGAPLQ